MLIKVAWRNIWRAKVRSVVVILAITIGLWAGVFSSAFVSGLMKARINKVINMELAHLQVHDTTFRDELLPKYVIQGGNAIAEELRADSRTKGVSERVIAMPMFSSANHSGAIKVTGINPEDEKIVTELYQYIDTGFYFEGVNRNPIVISSLTAEKYKLSVRSKVVLTLQDVHGEMVADNFRVAGIYDTKNAMYDELNAFVLKENLQEMLGIGSDIHEIAVRANAHEFAEPMAEEYAARYEDLEVLCWMDLQPALRLMVEMQDTYTLWIVGIIMVALLFSIINTMLMAVLDRVREIGMLMAIGMNKLRVFGMIILETLFLCLIGGPLGLFISWATIQYFGSAGIDLGDAAYGEMGFSNIVYPFLETEEYLQVTVMVIIMAILGALYPAWKALRLNPVEAIRKI